eukprot:Polyplicarium_translucidae@DN1537_c0_g1_i1.p1
MKSRKRSEKPDTPKAKRRKTPAAPLHLTVVLLGAELKVAGGDSGGLQHADNPSTSPLRPDIVHQSLMTLLDSPLNRKQRLSILLSTADKKLVRVASEFRIPRTWKVFQKVMVDFLSSPTGVLRGGAEGPVVLESLQPPLARHLPPGAAIVGLSASGKLVRLKERAKAIAAAAEGEERCAVCAIGAVSEGSPTVTMEGVSEVLSISALRLSTAVVCDRVCDAFESVF